MSTTAKKTRLDQAEDELPVTLGPEQTVELEQAMAEADEDERAGRLIPLEVFLADRRMG